MKWQPIETAPKDGTRVLIVLRRDGKRISASGMWLNGDWYANGVCSSSDGPPTHWMPLPPPPTEEAAP